MTLSLTIIVQVPISQTAGGQYQLLIH